MCKKLRHQAARQAPLRRPALAGCTALVACVGALVTACGGSNDDLAAPIRVTAYRLAADVTPTGHWAQLEGCVVDEYFIPRTGTSVQAQSADGRLVGTASSDMNGVFRMQVPARQTVSVRIDKPGGESLALVTGRSNLSVGACLRDPYT